LAAVLPGPEEVVQFTVEPRGTPLPVPHRNFAQALGIPATSSNRSYSLGSVWLAIPRNGVARISDARLLPTRQRVFQVPGLPIAEADLPRYLRDLNNGPRVQRDRYQRIQRLFAALTQGRQVAVGDRPSASLGEDVPVVRVSVDENFEVPIEFAGAAAWELLVLAAMLGQPEPSVVALDEPGLGAHPTLQQTLIENLQNASAQVVLITHSPHLLPLRRRRGKTGGLLVRIARQGYASQSWIVPGYELAHISKKLLAKRNDGLPFAERAILCEGQTDTEVVRIVADRLGLPTAAANVAIADCGGKPSLPDYVRFCAKLGIPHLAIMDMDSSPGGMDPSTPGRNEALREAVAASGKLGSLLTFAKDVEGAFGLSAKDNERLLASAGTVSLETGEPGGLAAALKGFLPETPVVAL
jgi:hypothetical protein